MPRRTAQGSRRCATGRPEPWRSIQEPLDGWDEARRILEQEGVTGIGVQDQPGAGHAGGQEPVVGRRVQLIQRAVGDQRRDPQFPNLPSGGILSRQPLLNGKALACLRRRRRLVEAWYRRIPVTYAPAALVWSGGKSTPSTVTGFGLASWAAALAGTGRALPVPAWWRPARGGSPGLDGRQRVLARSCLPWTSRAPPGGADGALRSSRWSGWPSRRCLTTPQEPSDRLRRCQRRSPRDDRRGCRRTTAASCPWMLRTR